MQSPFNPGQIKCYFKNSFHTVPSAAHPFLVPLRGGCRYVCFIHRNPEHILLASGFDMLEQLVLGTIGFELIKIPTQSNKIVSIYVIKPLKGGHLTYALEADRKNLSNVLEINDVIQQISQECYVEDAIPSVDLTRVNT